MSRMLIFCLAFSILLFNLAFSQSSKPVKLKGIIVDAQSGKVIPGANIKVLSTNKGASSNADGKFMIHDLPSGIYSLKISYIGYKDKIVTDITVYENKQNSITIKLQESVITGESITVSAGYFTREDSDIVSFRTFNTEEIRRYPGAGQELSRVISSSAGVVTTGESSQDLMVRGGSPRENGFYVDGIFIPSIKHFEQIDGSSNGPIGLINTNLVNSVDFYAGGFTAAYGKRMSSIGVISYKKPNEEEFSGNLNASLAGFGGMLEGPIKKEKSSFFISARRSYLDILSDAINAGGAPRYGDIQAKVLYELNKNNELTFLQIYGDSQFSSPLDQAKQNGRFTYPIFRNQQNTSGLNLRTFWDDKIYTNTSFSYSFTSEELDNKYVNKDSKEFSYDNQYKYLNFRSNTYWKVSNRFSFEFGTDLMYSGGKFNYFFDQRTDDFGNKKPVLNKNAQLSQYEGSVFSNMILKPSHSIILNLGSRTGYNSLNKLSSPLKDWTQIKPIKFILCDHVNTQKNLE